MGKKRNYPCSQCSKYFQSPSQVMFHEKTHDRKNSPVREDTNDIYLDSPYKLPEGEDDDNEVWEERQVELSKLIVMKLNQENCVTDPLADSTENGAADKKNTFILEDGQFTCQICDDKFQKDQDFWDHFHRQHGSPTRQPFEAKRVGKKKTRVSLKRKSKVPTTSKTSQIFPRVRGRKRHQTIVHKVSSYPRRVIKDIRPIQFEDYGSEFQCSFCPSSYSSKTQKRVHEETYHFGETPFVCEYCACSFSLAKGLKCHLSKFHKQVPNEVRRMSIEKITVSLNNPVESSSQQTNTVENFEINDPPDKDISQIQSDDDVNEFQCSFCPSSYSRESKKRIHEETHHSGETPFVCQFCSCSFTLAKGLRFHLSKFHKQVSVELRRVSLEKVTVSVNSLVESPSTKSDITENLEIDHSRGEVKQKKFSSKDDPEFHSSIESSKKLPKVQVSDAKVKNPPSSASRSAKPSETNTSSSSSETKSSIDSASTKNSNRVTIVYADDTYCAYCPLSFTSKLGKAQHERIHTGERPFPCQYCPLTFRLSYMLTNHMKRRHPEKPYTTKRVFECDSCHLSFQFRKLLKKHKKNVHFKLDNSTDPESSTKNGTSFVCDICNTSFKRLGFFMRHKVKAHSSKLPKMISKEFHHKKPTSNDELTEESTEALCDEQPRESEDLSNGQGLQMSDVENDEQLWSQFNVDD